MRKERAGFSSLSFGVQLLVILGGVALVTALLYALFLPGIRRLLAPVTEMGTFFEEMREFDARVKAATPAAGILIGEAKSWRSIEKPKGILSLSSVAGNFDGDSDEEVVVLCDRQSFLLELDGSVRQIGMASNMVFMRKTHPLDFDGDGIDELVPDATLGDLGRKNSSLLSANPGVNPSLHSVVFDVDGKQKGLLFGVHSFSSTCAADLDLNGSAEVVLLDNSASNTSWKVLVYGTNGAKLLSALVPAPTESIHAGNVAGDPVPELLLGYYDSAVLGVIKTDGSHSEITLPEKFARLGAVADMDGDGLDEVFNGAAGYLNLATDQYVELHSPDGFPLESALFAEVFAFDTNGDGSKEVVTLAGPEFYFSGVYIFEADGRCIYHEEFGKLAEEAVQAESSENEHLVLIFEDEIKVWP